MINRLEKFIDGLEKITSSLEALQTKLKEEVETISDVDSLRLLRDVASGSSQHSLRMDVSDTASRRLIMVTGSIAENESLLANTLYQSTTGSFITANTGPSDAASSLAIPGAWPRSLRTENRKPPLIIRSKAQVTQVISCEQCLVSQLQRLTFHVAVLSI